MEKDKPSKHRTIDLNNGIIMNFPRFNTQESELISYSLYRISSEIYTRAKAYIKKYEVGEVEFDNDIDSDLIEYAYNDSTRYTFSISVSAYQSYYKSLNKKHNIGRNELITILESIKVSGKNIKYNKASDKMEIDFSKSFYDEIGYMTGNYTIYDLDEINKLKTVMGRKIYLLLRKNHKQSKTIMSAKQYFDYFKFYNSTTETYITTNNQNTLINRGIADIQKNLIGVTVKFERAEHNTYEFVKKGMVTLFKPKKIIK